MGFQTNFSSGRTGATNFLCLYLRNSVSQLVNVIHFWYRNTIPIIDKSINYSAQRGTVWMRVGDHHNQRGFKHPTLVRGSISATCWPTMLSQKTLNSETRIIIYWNTQIQTGKVICCLTFSGKGAGVNLLAQTRKESGCGLPFFTSSSSPSTTWWNKPKKSLCRLVFMSNVRRAELVATAIGTPSLCRWWTSFSTPGWEDGRDVRGYKRTVRTFFPEFTISNKNTSVCVKFFWMHVISACNKPITCGPSIALSLLFNTI